MRVKKLVLQNYSRQTNHLYPTICSTNIDSLFSTETNLLRIVSSPRPLATAVPNAFQMWKRIIEDHKQFWMHVKISVINV